MNLRRDRLVREVRSTIAGGLDLVAELSGKLADRIDPPVPVDDPPREEALQRQASRARHPAYVDRPQTLLGDLTPPEDPLVLRVPTAQLSVVRTTGDGWTACTLGVISATRPIGARVRLTHPQTGVEHEGTLSALLPSDLSTVRYVLAIEEEDGRTVLDLPLSHPLEVRRD